MADEYADLGEDDTLLNKEPPRPPGYTQVCTVPSRRTPGHKQTTSAIEFGEVRHRYAVASPTSRVFRHSTNKAGSALEAARADSGVLVCMLKQVWPSSTRPIVWPESQKYLAFITSSISSLFTICIKGSCSQPFTPIDISRDLLGELLPESFLKPTASETCSLKR